MVSQVGLRGLRWRLCDDVIALRTQRGRTRHLGGAEVIGGEDAHTEGSS